MNKPNILFLMCDQFQGRVLSADSPCKTPNLRRVIENGVRFQNAYTPNAICSPARASLMTGLLPHNHGVLFVTHCVDDDQGCLRLRHPHWAQRLAEGGYHTGYFGKWHVERTEQLENFGWQVNGGSNGRLYEEYKEKITGNFAAAPKPTHAKYVEYPEGYNPKKLLYGITPIPPEKRRMGITTSMALDFLNKTMPGDDPWCCFVSLSEPHDPFICGEAAHSLYDPNALKLPPNITDDLEGRPNLYKKAARAWHGMSKQECKEAIACYYASITEIDGQFGRLIDRVKAAGQLDNTIIVFTADHGELMGAHGLYCKNVSAYEEVYNIPLVLSGPGIAHNKVSDARVGLHDLAQTLLELAGCETFDVPDSQAFTDLLVTPDQSQHRQTGFAEYFGSRILLTQRVVWNGPWKYIFNGFDYDELYNLHDDPYEMNNLAGQQAYDGVLRSMCAQLWKTVKETNDQSLYQSDYPILRLASYGPGINA